MYKCVSETWRIGTAKLTFVKYSSIKPWHETMGSEQTVCLSFSPVIHEYHYCTNTLLCKNSLHIMKSLYSTLIKFTACRKSDFVISVSEKRTTWVTQMRLQKRVQCQLAFREHCLLLDCMMKCYTINTTWQHGYTQDSAQMILNSINSSLPYC